MSILPTKIRSKITVTVKKQLHKHYVPWKLVLLIAMFSNRPQAVPVLSPWSTRPRNVSGTGTAPK